MSPLRLKIVALGTFLALSVASSFAGSFPISGPTVPGSHGQIRYGVAYAPADAPMTVKRVIWAGNQLRGKPYRYGGGHHSFYDSGYDCSGSVSYALAGAGLVRSPMSSSDFRRFGSSGRGKWITIYARNGHAFAVIAGLRFDTTPFDNAFRRHDAPGWKVAFRAPSGFEARHPENL
jgi:hypothetical protein